ncbi:MAG: TonB-dependent receptor [Verrucomicrobiota bacterium]
MKTNHKPTILSGLIFLAPGLIADSPIDTVLELDQLVVTAELWSTPISETSASVSLISADQLNVSAVDHFDDLIESLPNVTWTAGTSRPRYIQIRGLGENSQFEGETPDSSVRFLMDDIDVTGLGTVASLLDVNQVEVLRGPQAGAFGANAAGGLIRVVSEDPTSVWTGNLSATIAEDDLRTVSAAVGGPLSQDNPETLTIRVAAQISESNGFRDNATLGRDDTNGRDEQFVRAKMRWVANDSMQWDLTGFYGRADNGYDAFVLDNNGFTTFSDEPGQDFQETLGASLRGTFTGWESVALTSVTSGTFTDSINSFDADWTAASYGGFSRLDRERTVLSQEFRLDSTDNEDAFGWIDRWTFGAYLQSLEEDSTGLYRDFFTPEGDFDTVYESQTLAIFGQLAHNISSKSRIILGLRVEQFDLETRSEFRAEDNDFDDTLWGGKLTFEQDIAPGQMIFVSATRGYKAGGANIYPFLENTDPLIYDTETLWNYEIGYRGISSSGRLSGEITAFYLDRSNTQVRDAAGFGGSFRFFTDNGDDAEIYGVEASGQFALSRELILYGNLGLMSSDIDSFVLSNGTPAGGRELAYTPEYSYTVGLRYQGESGFFGYTELVGRDSYFESNSHDAERSSFTIVNASLGYAWDSWKITIWARNLLDERYDNRVFFFGNDEDLGFAPARYESAADPRQVGMTASYLW